MTTKHTHPVIFGGKVAGCPRCTELLAGAEPIRWTWRDKAADNRRHAEEVRSHFASHKHLSGGCGPVCTFGEW
jgi:hypothetical protein